MVAYDWSREHNAWIKECTSGFCTIKIFVGTQHEAESIEIFKKYFGYASASSRSVDGFDSRCRDCAVMHVHRRKYPGYVDRRTMLRLQGGKCSLCNEDITLGNNDWSGAQVDHDHETNKPRELLCRPCNNRLGRLEASYDPVWLERARAYLRRHRK